VKPTALADTAHAAALFLTRKDGVDMTRLPGTRLLLTTWLLLAAAVVQAHSADRLQEAYTAILRGDYDTARSVVRELESQPGETPSSLQQVADWLDRFAEVTASRAKLRRETFAWNVEHAQEALKEGRVYLALSFAAQALPYAEDADAFRREAWVQDLRSKALAAGDEFAQQGRWQKAHNFYVVLQRLFERDETIKERRERAARHVRLEVLYRTAEDVERRIKDVTPNLLYYATLLIAEHYFEKPDFRRMAGGALDNLVALCSTEKLYSRPDSSSAFDGVANPALREHFLGKIEELRKQVHQADAFGQGGFIRLYRAVRDVNQQTVSLPEGLLIIEFMEGALGELDDFTSIVWPADAEEFDKMMIGEFKGVGIQLGVDDVTGRLMVVTPLENSPALRAGVQPGDLIVKVDGVSTRDWTTDKAVREITGQEGTRVVLTLFRPRTGKFIDVPLTRSRIQLTTVRGVKRLDEAGQRWDYMLDPQAGIAYIRLTGFNPDSHEELLNALREAKKQGMKGLVLDLRHNPGGLLDVAVDIVSEFVESGEVVSTVGRKEPRQELRVRGNAQFPDLPLVVLVNEASASASEILAGAMQDHNRAVVLGERTFGKGSVQRVLYLNRQLLRSSKPSARLKLTTALYYLPSGRTPHKERPDDESWGIEPDWKVVLTPKEFAKVLEREREAFVIHNEEPVEEEIDPEELERMLAELKSEDDTGDEDDQKSPLLSAQDIKLLCSDPYEAGDFDPQLETALLHLRVKLAANLPWPRQLARKPAAEPTP